MRVQLLLDAAYCKKHVSQSLVKLCFWHLKKLITLFHAEGDDENSESGHKQIL